MKIQWLAELNPSNFHSLEDVRNDLFKYVNKYNNTPHSSLEYRTPQDRFFKESSLIRKHSDDSISRTADVNFAFHPAVLVLVQEFYRSQCVSLIFYDVDI